MEERLGSIYCGINRINGDMYFGQTLQEKPEQRIREHKRARSDRYFHNAINYYGVDNFDFIWFHYKTIKLENLDAIEQYYIKKYNTEKPNGYNLTEGGQDKSYYHSKTTREKISESSIGKVIPPEVREKISKSLSGENHPYYGIPVPEERKQKIRESNLGQKRTEEAKQNMRNAQRKRFENHQYASDQLLPLFKSNTTLTQKFIRKELNLKISTLSNWIDCLLKRNLIIKIEYGVYTLKELDDDVL